MSSGGRARDHPARKRCDLSDGYSFTSKNSQQREAINQARVKCADADVFHYHLQPGQRAVFTVIQLQDQNTT